LLQCVLFEKYIHILALEMAGSGNQHCADCMGTVLVPCETLTIYAAGLFDHGVGAVESECPETACGLRL